MLGGSTDRTESGGGLTPEWLGKLVICGGGLM